MTDKPIWVPRGAREEKTSTPYVAAADAFVFEAPSFAVEGQESCFASSETLFSLPAAFWTTLASLLRASDLVHTAHTCREWKKSLAAFAKCVTWDVQLSSSLNSVVLTRVVPRVERLVFVDAATLTVCATRKEGLTKLAHLTSLRLDLPLGYFSPTKMRGGPEWTELCLLTPHLPTTLQELALPVSRVTRGSLSPLRRLQHLTHLDLSKCDWLADDWNYSSFSDAEVSSAWVDCLPTSLIELNLAHCHVLTDASLRKFTKLTNLRALNLENCFQLTDSGVSSLSTLLEDLNLSQCIGVFRKGDARPGVLPSHLARLRLSINFNDHFCAYIPSSLRCLLLEKAHVTDAGMILLLKGLKHLEELSVAACVNVGNLTLVAIPRTVRKLDVWCNRNITDIGLKTLKQELRVLDVTDCPLLTVAGVVQAANHLSQLQMIAVGSLFVPSGSVPGAAILRTPEGTQSSRPKLFEALKI